MEERLKAVEKQYGVRPKIAIAHGESLQTHHFRGEQDTGEKFVYCPVGFLASWHPEDYSHKYCAWCKEFF